MLALNSNIIFLLEFEKKLKIRKVMKKGKDCVLKKYQHEMFKFSFESI